MIVFCPTKGANKWVKVFAGNELVLDKAIQFSEKGIFGEVFKFAPSSDTKILVEFHCDKDKCYNTSTKSLKTIPDYTVSYKDISCFGSSNGEVKLMPETVTDMDLVWESGDRKNIVTNMHHGVYNVTIENSNGCKAYQRIVLHDPAPLKIKPTSISVDDGSSLTNYVQLAESGGSGSCTFDWDHDGMGDMDDKSSTKYSIGETYEVKVMDQNGCWAQEEISFSKGNVIDLSGRNVSLIADKYINNSLYKYNLHKSLNPDNGDIDGDGLSGSIYDIAFYKDEAMKIQISALDEENFEGKPNEKIYAKIADSTSFNLQSILLAPDAAEFCLQNSEACDNDSPVELIPVTCAQLSTPLPSGGTYTAFKLDGTPENFRLSGPDNAGRYYFDPTNGSGNYVIVYLLNGVEYEALFDI